MEEENRDRKILRNKMVSFMYLIFIVLAFIYIPADFVDTIKDIDTSLSLSSSEINQAKNYKQLMIKAGLAADTLNQLNTKSTNFQKISKLTDSVCHELDVVRKQILSVSGGLNEYGYLKYAKDNQFTDKIMLEEGSAAKMRNMLIQYKELVSKNTSSISKATLDSILPTSPIIKTSKGKDIEWEKFYFHKMPLTVSVALVSKFENDVKAIESIAMNEYLKKLQEKYNLQLVDKNIKKEEPKPVEEKKPETVSAEAFIRGDDYNTLYKDLNNKIAVYHPNIPSNAMNLTATNGEIFRKGDAFYLRLRDEGFVQVNAYSGTNLIITQKFIVKTLPDPFVYVADRRGGKVSHKIMKAQKSLVVKNDFVKAEMDYKIKGFSVMRIGAADSQISKVEANKGDFFNSAAKELIEKAEKGDTYIFDNIEIETPYGTTLKVSPSIFTIF